MQSDLWSHVLHDDSLKAQILWTLKVVRSNFSEDDRKKFAYIATFALGPGFLDLLKEKAKSSDSFVLLFDELLKDSLQ